MGGSWVVCLYESPELLGRKWKDDLIRARHALGIIKWSMAAQIPSCYKNQFSKNIELHSVMEKETHC